MEGRIRGRRARCRATPNAPKAGGVSQGSNWARAGDFYDIIERGGAREGTSADEADGASPGVRRRWVDVAGRQAEVACANSVGARWTAQ